MLEIELQNLAWKGMIKEQAEIGNIEQFLNAKKQAKFAGIARWIFSAGKGKDVCLKQSNRRLQMIFYFYNSDGIGIAW